MARHVLVRELERHEHSNFALMLDWMRAALGCQQFDEAVLDHPSTFTLAAGIHGEIEAFLPVQRPLMLESVAFRPGISEEMQSLVMTRLAEHAIESAFRRRSGEVYFLCQEPATKSFAERHFFKRVEMDLMRFNVRDWERGA